MQLPKTGTLQLPEIKEIGELAFGDCSFDSINLGPNLEYIDRQAFKDSSKFKLKSVTVHALTPPELEDEVWLIKKDSETEADRLTRLHNIRLYVPQASLYDYQTTPQWEDFFVHGVTGIEDIEEDAFSLEPSYPTQAFDMLGRHIEAFTPATAAPGLYLVSFPEGFKKVLVK